MRGTHGWAEISLERKREIIAAIRENRATRGPVHAELDLTDRCNVACYFCNQQDLRTKASLPLPKLTDLIDELAETGLRSVRLSGGGDPLFHRDAVAVLDHLASRQIVVDNLTTNAVALTPAVAKRLVENHAREVLVSLNAVDAADYGRMMQVKPALFDRVLENVRTLLSIRGGGTHPSVAVQFLLDRTNVHRLVEMYELGRSLGVDRIAVNGVLEIPGEHFDETILLQPEDRELVRPHLREILKRDADASLLQLNFAIAGWNEVIEEERAALGTEWSNVYPTAPSFREENGGCFFAWYTAAVTGTGDIRPCCLLLSPAVKPLGNVFDGRFSDHWNGPAFTKMRDEMREVLLMKGRVRYTPKRFEILKENCVVPNLCWLKNMYFRGDQQFYAELEDALRQARSEEVRFTGDRRKRRRAIEHFVQQRPPLRRAWLWLIESSRPARIFLKRAFGWNLTDAA